MCPSFRILGLAEGPPPSFQQCGDVQCDSDAANQAAVHAAHANALVNPIDEITWLCFTSAVQAAHQAAPD